MPQLDVSVLAYSTIGSDEPWMKQPVDTLDCLQPY